MNKNREQHIENFLNESLSKKKLNTPSPEFVSQVMNNLEHIEEQKSRITQYQPPISSHTWLIIAFSALISFILISLFSKNNFSYVPDFSEITGFLNHFFSLIVYSDIWLYSILSLSIFFSLDILLISRLQKKQETNNAIFLPFSEKSRVKE